AVQPWPAAAKAGQRGLSADSTLSGCRPTMNTLASRSSSAAESARPIPDEPPVTRKNLPWKTFWPVDRIAGTLILTEAASIQHHVGMIPIAEEANLLALLEPTRAVIDRNFVRRKPGLRELAGQLDVQFESVAGQVEMR